jgi:hypothetical protein
MWVHRFSGQPVRASDDAHEHFGVTTGPDLVLGLVALGPRSIESKWHRPEEEEDGRVEDAGHLLCQDGADSG